MAVKLSISAAELVIDLRCDSQFEGDLNNYSNDAVVECLQQSMIKICSCRRPFRNMRLTRKGQNIEITTIETVSC